MAPDLQQAYNALKRIKAPVQKTYDGFIIVGSPDSKWVDSAWVEVNPKIDKILLKSGLYYEWDNNGDLQIHEN